MKFFFLFFPEIYLSLGSLILLLINTFFVKRNEVKISLWFILYLSSLFLFAFTDPSESYERIFNHFVNSPSLFYFRLILFSLGVVYFYGLYRYLYNEKHLDEFSFLLGVCIAFLSFLCSSVNFLVAFLFIECISFIFYMLVSFYKRSLLSVEAGLKYFVLGTLASFFFLLGIFLFYLDSLKLNILDIPGGQFKVAYFLGQLGLIFIFIGVVFKLGGAPFQFWMPEVYQGAPFQVLPMLIALSKLSFVVFMGNIVYALTITNEFVKLNSQIFSEVFYLLSVLSMLIGNLLALKQNEVKRLLAYSSIAHIGYFLSLLALPWHLSMFKIYYGYIFIYAITNFFFLWGLFLVFNFEAIKLPIKTFEEILKGKNVLYLVSLLVLIFSLAGLPPTAGFLTKLFLILELIKGELYFLAFIFLSTSVLSMYYYFKLIAPILKVLREKDSNFSVQKMELRELIVSFVMLVVSLYLVFSTFAPDFIFFFK